MLKFNMRTFQEVSILLNILTSIFRFKLQCTFKKLTSKLAMQNSRVRGYCFTINNPTPDDLSNVRSVDCQYIIFGFEEGENNTPHLQGYIHFSKSMRFSAVKALLPRSHLEKRKGTPQQAIDYCKKDGVFEERGVPPVSKEHASKQVWKQLLEKSQEGDFAWIKENYPRMWIQFSHKLESLQLPKTTVLDGNLQHEWWIGNTGTGKSKALWQLYPEHFQKGTNKWWCGYAHEDVVAIEEWSPKNECTGSFLKIWADRYPFTGEIKGGTLKKIRPRKLIVLSNYSIQDCFPDSRDYEPLLRRFNVLRFPDDLEVAKIRASAFHVQSLESDLIPEAVTTDTISTVPIDDDYFGNVDLSFIDDGLESNLDQLANPIEFFEFGSWRQ